MNFERPKYAKNPEKIVEAALETVGLTFDDLGTIAGVRGRKLRRRLRSKRLGSGEWIAICEALYLRPWDAFSCGYMKAAHKYEIRKALLDSYYRLPLTREFLRLLQEFICDAIEAWKYPFYGTRLRWRARRQDGWKLIKRILARRYRHRDAQAYLRDCYSIQVEGVIAVGLRREIGTQAQRQDSPTVS